MKRVFGVTALAAVGVLATMPAAQAAVTVNDRLTIPFSVFIPCANGGAGEVVSGTVTLHELFTFTLNGNNVSGKTHEQPMGGHLTGESTGLKYQPTGVTQDHFKASLQNGQQIFTSVNNFRIIGQGPGNNFLVHENFHFTINANGTVTVVHDNFRIECT